MKILRIFLLFFFNYLCAIKITELTKLQTENGIRYKATLQNNKYKEIQVTYIETDRKDDELIKKAKYVGIFVRSYRYQYIASSLVFATEEDVKEMSEKEAEDYFHQFEKKFNKKGMQNNSASCCTIS
jgi:hypothetical protein